MTRLSQRSFPRKMLLVLLLLLNAGASRLCAQEDLTATSAASHRPAFASTALLVGRAHLHDSYLSINNYSGYELGLMHERLRALPFGNGKWVMRHRIDASAANAFSPSQSGHLISAMLDYSYGQLYTRRCGALYNPRNSNNPAAAKVNLSLGFAEMLTYTLHLGRIPVTLRYQLSLPVMSLFFSPGFGESYYEIFYLGNHSGIVKFGAWHNRFDMNNLLTVEIPIGRAALRIGYDNRIRTSRANHLDYFHYTNAFVIGVATPINRTPSTSGRSTIQAYY